MSSYVPCCPKCKSTLTLKIYYSQSDSFYFECEDCEHQFKPNRDFQKLDLSKFSNFEVLVYGLWCELGCSVKETAKTLNRRPERIRMIVTKIQSHIEKQN